MTYAKNLALVMNIRHTIIINDQNLPTTKYFKISGDKLTENLLNLEELWSTPPFPLF